MDPTHFQIPHISVRDKIQNTIKRELKTKQCEPNNKFYERDAQKCKQGRI